jgi:3-methyladenine DNA glycosylase AlkD
MAVRTLQKAKSARESAPTYRRMLAALEERADAKRAVVTARYFKTGPGEYGEGDVFIGLTVPQIRTLARELKAASLETVERLLTHPIHEARALALMIMTMQYERAGVPGRTRIFRSYVRRLEHVNNWDLVDGSAPTLVGGELERAAALKLVDRWSRSRSVWERRVAVLATLTAIRNAEFALTLRLCERLLEDEHDLIHKACGWMLREVGKRDERALTRWLDRFAPRMPRTMLRYAIERFPERRRRHYLELES